MAGVESVAYPTREETKGDEGDETGCLVGGRGQGRGCVLVKSWSLSRVSSEQGREYIWLRTASPDVRCIPENVTKEICTLGSTGHSTGPGPRQSFEFC